MEEITTSKPTCSNSQKIIFIASCFKILPAFPKRTFAVQDALKQEPMDGRVLFGKAGRILKQEATKIPILSLYILALTHHNESV